MELKVLALMYLACRRFERPGLYGEDLDKWVKKLLRQPLLREKLENDLEILISSGEINEIDH